VHNVSRLGGYVINIPVRVLVATLQCVSHSAYIFAV